MSCPHYVLSRALREGYPGIEVRGDARIVEAKRSPRPFPGPLALCRLEGEPAYKGLRWQFEAFILYPPMKVPTWMILKQERTEPLGPPPWPGYPGVAAEDLPQAQLLVQWIALYASYEELRMVREGSEHRSLYSESFPRMDFFEVHA